MAVKKKKGSVASKIHKKGLGKVPSKLYPSVHFISQKKPTANLPNSTTQVDNIKKMKGMQPPKSAVHSKKQSGHSHSNASAREISAAKEIKLDSGRTERLVKRSISKKQAPPPFSLSASDFSTVTSAETSSSSAFLPAINAYPIRMVPPKRRYASPMQSLIINLNPRITTITSFRRRSQYAICMKLQDKLSYLIKKGICLPTEYAHSEQVNTLSICQQFSQDNHNTMLLDDARLRYYREAMHYRLSKPSTSKEHAVDGKRILEIGTGPHAVLAVNAINSGAKFVDALEVNYESSQQAKHTLEQYGFHQIAVHFAHSKTFPLQDKHYDLIIHEILGDFMSQEGVADVLCDIQKRLGYFPRSIPYAASSVICPAMFPEPDDIRCPSSTFPERTIISPKRILFQSVQLNFQQMQLSDFQAFETLHFEEDVSSQLRQSVILEFSILRPGLMAGLLCGIDVEIHPNVFFGTRYVGQTNSWYTTLILLPEEIQVETRDIVYVKCMADLQNYDEIDMPRRFSKSSLPPTLCISRPTYQFEVTVKRQRVSTSVAPTTNRPISYKIIKHFQPIKIPFAEQAPRVYKPHPSSSS
ncbi:hypothetical protein IE077_000120 [Cardiosporidium cionae]|uniref:Uncharacterized protein n=1 Tax=Cardiosporidium cionae TaxID=476202 RepID=A0ABQ7JDD3_9APIC|nr:hypothetical protein IE077_000120 [Cardiosporidium cionae]|eukprot:KAF8822009.1 hypothetical protein IE077_000120 [Cardiosporidium cionae]